MKQNPVPSVFPFCHKFDVLSPRACRMQGRAKAICGKSYKMFKPIYTTRNRNTV